MQRDGVRLAEEHAIRIVFRLVPHDDVFFESDLFAVFDLFKPRQPKRVSGQAGDDVVVAVAIDVVSEHVRSARPGELVFVKRPQRIAIERLRLLVPTALPNHISAAVAVDVADSQAMSKRKLADLL